MAITRDVTYNIIINKTETYLDKLKESEELMNQLNFLVSNLYIYNNLTEVTKLKNSRQEIDHKIYVLKGELNKLYTEICEKIFLYLNKHKDVTLDILEKSFREENENIYLIAKKFNSVENGLGILLNSEKKSFEVNVVLTRNYDYYIGELNTYGFGDNMENLKDAGFIEVIDRTSFNKKMLDDIQN
jgi:hypothetical protein